LDDLPGAESDLRKMRENDPNLGGSLLALVILERIERGERAPDRALLDEARALSRENREALDADEREVLDALVLRRLDGKLDEARARLAAAEDASPSVELCLALARLAATPEERARWRDAGLRSAPGDARLRNLR
jgi:hypothetical protein